MPVQYNSTSAKYAAALLLGFVACSAQATGVTTFANTTVEHLQSSTLSAWEASSAGFYGLQLDKSTQVGLQLNHYRRYGLDENNVQARVDWRAAPRGQAWTLKATVGGNAYLPLWSTALALHENLPGERVLNIGAGLTSYDTQKVYPLDVSVDQTWRADTFTAGSSAYVAPGLPTALNAWGQWFHDFGDNRLFQIRLGWGDSQDALPSGELVRYSAAFGFAHYRQPLSHHWFVDVYLGHAGGEDARNSLTIMVNHVD